MGWQEDSFVDLRWEREKDASGRPCSTPLRSTDQPGQAAACHAISRYTEQWLCLVFSVAGCLRSLATKLDKGLAWPSRLSPTAGSSALCCRLLLWRLLRVSGGGVAGGGAFFPPEPANKAFFSLALRLSPLGSRVYISCPVHLLFSLFIHFQLHSLFLFVAVLFFYLIPLPAALSQLSSCSLSLSLRQ